ncbi:vWA domain-containing protein [Rhodopirellula baltica]|uniref:Integrator complex subunit 14 n=1 Tax=Rhodopirellula baltica SWK14 TaxID=993516 RepID=L7CHP5_RHOBT|nr:BatA and WFA domain-containing protein [Rhodopirellula baltica]ELP33508.1 von Willebrand factor type A [Rhodopirellula baltica SWK14]
MNGGGMSWIPALSGVWPWVVLACVPVGIVLLYFLKLRREPVEVPSTYLWSRTIEDLHVNSLLQRLRNSLLLLLQLLAVLLAAFAMFRPGIRGEANSLGRMVFLLDTSASMQAPAGNAEGAGQGGRSRFEEARRQIGDRIDTMTDSESAMLVTFSDRAEVMQAFTSDRNRLRDALDRCEVTNRPTDILGALRAADGLANPRRTSEIGDVNDVQVADAMPAELMLYSDGNFGDVTQFSLGNLQPTYVAIGSGAVRNLAIVSFSAQRDLQNPDQIQVFATVLNTGTSDESTEASLYIDQNLVDAASVKLEPEAQTGLSFTIESSDAVALRLQLDSEDDLMIDNEAFAALTPAGLVSVLVVTPGNRALELGLTTPKCQQIASCEFVTPDYMETEAYQKRVDSGRDDLIVFDRCRPKDSPPTSTFTMGELPNDDWKWKTESGALTLIDIDRTHPVLRYLELYSLLVFSGRAVEGPSGSLTLVESDVGPVMAIASRDGYQDLVLGFPLVSEDESGDMQANTNWYAERSWPVFMFNVLRNLAGAAQSSGAPSYQPGQTVMARLENVLESVEVVRTVGQGRAESLGKQPVAAGGVVEIVSTSLPGNYQLIAAETDQVVDRFAVNLFDARESRLAAQPTVELGYESVEATDAGIEVRREFWRPLLIAVLVLMALEWWFYTRRLA